VGGITSLLIRVSHDTARTQRLVTGDRQQRILAGHRLLSQRSSAHEHPAQGRCELWVVVVGGTLVEQFDRFNG